MSAATGREYVLTLSCPARPGIVYAVPGFLVQHPAIILASQLAGATAHYVTADLDEGPATGDRTVVCH